ncbi:hypothetical protein SOM26_15680 [Sphingomonas sp. CFBP8993]|nr:hypothetical protein [Sphingomonas sp. CFBP8993]
MKTSKADFRLIFVALPTTSASILATLLFGLSLGQWGSNLIWGSYFELGWCLSAFWSGGLFHDRFSMAVGVAWGWIAMIPLYAASGWLWEQLSERGRAWAIRMLLLSALPMAPGQRLMDWEAAGIHLPDYTLHLARSN